MTKAQWRGLWIVRRADCWPLLIIFAFFLLFFYPVFFQHKFFVINDAFVYSYPLRMTAWHEIKSGRLPVWTPLIMSGYPLLSMAQLGLAYPLTWGYLFLPGHWAEQIYIIAPYLLTPMFVYAYAREIGRTQLGSLLAGFSFGYGGLMVSAVANNGLLPNAAMWLPLILIALERARRGPFVPALLLAAAAYTMSVLSGIAQGFVYVGILAVAYALFLAIANNRLDSSDDRTTLSSRWRPLAVAITAIALSSGVAAFQILETMRAVRRSVRNVLTYQVFTEGSYTFIVALKTMLTPVHYVIHATAYVSPLALVLALVAVITIRHGDLRILFWVFVALLAWALMLGSNTPLYRLLYHIPVINSFRAPPRHAFEWTFAVAILSAYGWDAVEQRLRRRQQRVTSDRVRIAVVVLAFLLSAIGFVFWYRGANGVPATWDESSHYPSFFPESHYLFWKTAVALLVIGATWLSWTIASTGWRRTLLSIAIVLACFAEPSIMASRWWWPALKTAERFSTPSPATTFLQTHAPEQNRVYIRALPWLEEMRAQPRIDAGNLTMLFGLRNTGGYEPLILDRYSRALGNVGMDAANPRLGFTADESIFESRSHVLDLLNTAFVASYSDLMTEPSTSIVRDGIRFQSRDLAKQIQPGATVQIPGAARAADTLAVVSTLAFSGEEADGNTVAKIRLFTTDGKVIERSLRAGIETAEWAHDRPDVLTSIKHERAPIFDSSPSDANHTFESHRYWARISLDQPLSIERIEFTNVSKQALVSLSNLTLYDSRTHFSMPLPHYDLNRWEPAYERDDVEIIRNKRALPRAWLVVSAEAVDSEEALRRIRGDTDKPFDPRQTALLEVSAAELPQLPGGQLPSEASARLLSAESDRITVETQSQTAALLIVSEMIYPGWVATVDEQRTPIYTTDFVLRSVAVPAGTHRVEMRYTAPAALYGAIISLLSLITFAGLAISRIVNAFGVR